VFAVLLKGIVAVAIISEPSSQVYWLNAICQTNIKIYADRAPHFQAELAGFRVYLTEPSSHGGARGPCPFEKRILNCCFKYTFILSTGDPACTSNAHRDIRVGRSGNGMPDVREPLGAAL
jgi:hypothetical protein